MRKTITWFDDLEKISNEIEKRIKKISKRLENVPEGSLRVSKAHGKKQFYYKTDQHQQWKYIQRKDRHLAEQLAQKDYDPDAAYKVYDNLSEPRKELVTPEYLSDEELINQFLSQPYTRLGFNDDDPEFYTANGERVRSKSEILIADALRRHDVPYLCEYPVYNNGVIFAAPDFKCLNKRLRKVYYWEHLGMLGDQDYADRNVKKMDKYILADDFDENRLILTFETDSHPLNTKVIEAKIRKYLL